jgi:hypothetical protein
MFKKSATYLKAVCFGFQIAMFLCLGTAPSVCGAAAVERIEAIVVTDERTQLADPVVRRMEASVETIGDSLLLGKEITDLTAKKSAYEDVIRDVFDRILVGYSVETVMLRPQTAATVTVCVKPGGDTIRSVQVETSFAGISPPVSTFLKEHAGDYEDIIENILTLSGQAAPLIEHALPIGISVPTFRAQRHSMHHLHTGAIQESVRFHAGDDQKAGVRREISKIIAPMVGNSQEIIAHMGMMPDSCLRASLSIGQGGVAMQPAFQKRHIFLECSLTQDHTISSLLQEPGSAGLLYYFSSHCLIWLAFSYSRR